MARWTPLLDPGDFFERLEAPLRSGLAVFAVYVVASTVLLLFSLELLLAASDPLPTGLRSAVYGDLLAVVATRAIVLTLVLLAMAVGMYLLIGPARADGRFRDLLGVAGWAHAPDVLTAPILGALIYRRIARLELEAPTEREVIDQLEAVEGAAVSSIELALVIVVTAWSVYILAEGVRRTHDVPAVRAWAAAVLVGLGLLTGFAVGL